MMCACAYKLALSLLQANKCYECDAHVLCDQGTRLSIVNVTVSLFKHQHYSCPEVLVVISASHTGSNEEHNTIHDCVFPNVHHSSIYIFLIVVCCACGFHAFEVDSLGLTFQSVALWAPMLRAQSGSSAWSSASSGSSASSVDAICISGCRVLIVMLTMMMVITS